MRIRLPIASMSFVLLFGILALAQESPQTGGAKSKRTSEEGSSSSGTGGGASGSTTGSSTVSMEGKTKGEPKPGSLEDLIDKALKNHPDIRLAATKIRTAEAKVQEAKDELAREQHRIAVAVTDAYGKVESARSTVNAVKARFDIARDAQRRGVGTVLEAVSEEANVNRFQAELLANKAALVLLTSESPQAREQSGTSNEAPTKSSPVFIDPLGGKEVSDVRRIWLGTAHGRQGDWAAIQTCQACHSLPNDANAWNHGFSVSRTEPTMNDRIRKTLDKTLNIKRGVVDVPLPDLIDYLRETAGIEVPIRVLVKMPKQGDTPFPVSLMEGELPLGAWLQAVEDSVLEVRFVVREYGILVTNRDRVPEGAVYLQAFWKHKETAAPTKPDDTKKNAPKKETPK